MIRAASSVDVDVDRANPFTYSFTSWILAPVRNYEGVPVCEEPYGKAHLHRVLRGFAFRCLPRFQVRSPLGFSGFGQREEVALRFSYLCRSRGLRRWSAWVTWGAPVQADNSHGHSSWPAPV